MIKQQHTVRNSISSVAQSLFSHKELENKNCDQMQEMCFQKGVNWNDFAPKLKRGRMIVKETYQIATETTTASTTRSKWISQEPPIFTQDRTYLETLIPKL